MGALARFGVPFGTIRYLPLSRGLAPCDKLVGQYDVAPELLQDGWEVGRLVLDPRYRSGFESLKRCLFLTLVDLLEDHSVENLFASCTPVLSRLYRRFGFSVLVKDACADGEGSYSLIHGHVPDVLRALAATPQEKAMVGRILALRAATEALPC